MLGERLRAGGVVGKMQRPMRPAVLLRVRHLAAVAYAVAEVISAVCSRTVRARERAPLPLEPSSVNVTKPPLHPHTKSLKPSLIHDTLFAKRRPWGAIMACVERVKPNLSPLAHPWRYRVSSLHTLVRIAIALPVLECHPTPKFRDSNKIGLGSTHKLFSTANPTADD
jgi:hypothetical protein